MCDINMICRLLYSKMVDQQFIQPFDGFAIIEFRLVFYRFSRCTLIECCTADAMDIEIQWPESWWHENPHEKLMRINNWAVFQRLVHLHVSHEMQKSGRVKWIGSAESQ